jgi:hypothetical protein
MTEYNNNNSTYTLHTIWFQSVTNGAKKHKNIYLSQLLHALCKSGQVRKNGGSKYICICLCHQMPDTGYLETTASHKPYEQQLLTVTQTDDKIQTAIYTVKYIFKLQK